jgi:hypothetical protein
VGEDLRPSGASVRMRTDKMRCILRRFQSHSVTGINFCLFNDAFRVENVCRRMVDELQGILKEVAVNYSR